MPGEYEYWNSFAEGSAIDPGEIYVVCHGSADALILAECDEEWGYFGNGDDAICLAQGDADSSVCIDWIGDFNADPGSEWSGSRRSLPGRHAGRRGPLKGSGS